MSDDNETRNVAPESLTDDDIDDIEHGRVGCRCDRLLAEVRRLKSALLWAKVGPPDSTPWDAR